MNSWNPSQWVVIEIVQLIYARCSNSEILGSSYMNEDLICSEET